MATELAPARPTASTLTTAAVQSLKSALEGWSLADPLPASVDVEALRSAYRMAKQSLAPASPEGLAVLLDRLWATLPMPKTRDKSTGEMVPDRAAIAEWKRHLSAYPEDLLASAIDAVVKEHVWETPPKVAQVVKHLREEFDERVSWRNKLGTAGLKTKGMKSATTTGPLLRDQPAEDREAFFAKLREKCPDAFGMVSGMTGLG